ncbi:hypothetical protein DAPPUDRAFT_255846 [Daphnia pulex]|uniref:Uncharacterized protein n=1 Tax=Daphnia pulex TaxID=6669 RepID=E9HA81_DAPPU|nr:hypothetical protein DAPPUDRAFT_255846 [Daphnia pulex]|eukprot:EFX71393.1 hypothetical protein DAPPUDRAFT_255846 [Daphnia pulex]
MDTDVVGCYVIRTIVRDTMVFPLEEKSDGSPKYYYRYEYNFDPDNDQYDGDDDDNSDDHDETEPKEKENEEKEEETNVLKPDDVAGPSNWKKRQNRQKKLKTSAKRAKRATTGTLDDQEIKEKLANVLSDCSTSSHISRIKTAELLLNVAAKIGRIVLPLAASEQ